MTSAFIGGLVGGACSVTSLSHSPARNIGWRTRSPRYFHPSETAASKTAPTSWASAARAVRMVVTVLYGGQRMMLMRDDPPARPLAQTHGQPKLKWLALASVVDVDAMSDRGCKRDVTPSGDFNVGEVEGNWLFRTGEEQLPRGHVIIDAA